MQAPDSKLLDVRESNQRKVWLVKVPKHVAQAWNAACQQSLGSTGVDEHGQAQQLGTITISPKTADMPPEAEAPATLTIADTLPGLRGPRQYRLTKMHTNPAGAQLAVSFRTGDDNEPTALRLEGVVSQTYNAAPLTVLDAKGQTMVSAEYAELSRERTLAAETPRKPVIMNGMTREEQLAQRANKRNMLAVERLRPEEAKRQKEERKRVAADPKVLEAELFKLFVRQGTWHFTQLQAETQQPGPFLKAQLEKIAVQQKAGPNKGRWTLKKEYQVGGGEAAPA